MATNPCFRDYPNTFFRGICELTPYVTPFEGNMQCADGARLRNRVGTFQASITSEGCSGLERQTKCTQIRWDNSQLSPCCKGEIDTSNACAPDWCPGSAICSNELEEFCTENNGENITTSGCQAICVNPPTNQARIWCNSVQPTGPNNPNQPVPPGDPSNGVSILGIEFSTVSIIIIILVVFFIIIIIIFAVSSNSGTEITS